MLMFRSADLCAERVTAHDVLEPFLRSAAERQAVEYPGVQAPRGVEPVVRRYARRAGALVPVEVRSLADVKLAGPSSFVMRYDYEIVNGQATRDDEPTLLMARLSAGVRSPRE